MNIYVGNLSYQLTEADLEAAFAAYGTVASAKIITDRATGRAKGFGFVEMPNDAEAKKAIEELNDKELAGRPLRANESRPREGGDRGGRGGFGGGNGGGRGRY